MSKVYTLRTGSIHEQFRDLRTEVQLFGGGFGNGKTAAAVVHKILSVAHDYPGANILAARSTYPKLNDTLRKTFTEFCPAEWIKSFPMSKNSDNTCVLVNGSKINFRYIAQRSSTEDGGSTSNLLSATYDLAVIDQIEDPEITHKDFLDVVGRMRGSAVYRGNDPTMPRTGPGWIVLTTNPTRNWVYKELVEPLIRYRDTGVVSDKLLCIRDREKNVPILNDDGTPKLLIGLVEGSTYENAHVLPRDFIRRMESMYTGQMKDRFLKGEWAAYEGLVYPDFSHNLHVIRSDVLTMYRRELLRDGVQLNYYEGYDYGLQAPSCYLLSFTDPHGNIFVFDGFYQAEAPLPWQAGQIAHIRRSYGVGSQYIMADPSIMRRTASSSKDLVGRSVSDLFFEIDRELKFSRGNNDIMNGITKVRGYLTPLQYHLHPVTREENSPHLYISDKLTWLIDEIQSYYWKTNTLGERIDEPVDKNDHSLDALKYMLSYAPEPATFVKKVVKEQPYLTQWLETEPEPYHGY